MRGIGSFHCQEPRFISRGAAEVNKHGPVSRNNHTLTVLLYRDNTFYAQLFAFVELFMNM